ncbi:helix-turn-helix transcriptional regulator [Thalassotalea sp. 1_MG-2023]|uniref:helix-turn-helix domain-containing protein n=1 Tax=Thalassotalea sp. 1_MG-2023 TaxID=3062680 RepID=UPI0026E3DEB4|nr:helix-turn-helix transcriptional regulator [Thalassotalea sp. 1_MG-2023]MDO6426197.1 helix-turn-helix transcriptional regulator [Thalassotalea sp. 1_MG-2023]
MEIYEKLKKIRTSVDLSQSKFAQLVGIPESTYKKYEQNQSEISGVNLERILSNSNCHQYVLWFMTGKTDPSFGQIAPGDEAPDVALTNQILAQEEFDQQFMRTVEDSLIWFCHLGWLEPKFTKDDKIGFDTCSSSILKDVKSLLQKMPQHQHHLDFSEKTG